MSLFYSMSFLRLMSVKKQQNCLFSVNKPTPPDGRPQTASRSLWPKAFLLYRYLSHFKSGGSGGLVHSPNKHHWVPTICSTLCVPTVCMYAVNTSCVVTSQGTEWLAMLVGETDECEVRGSGQNLFFAQCGSHR